MADLFDFSGWATRNDLRCSDGRVIKRDAFKGNDGETVPLIWQHDHSTPEAVIGHALLENRKEGVYAYCALNQNEGAMAAREAIKHGDLESLSIYANGLKQNGNDVIHGSIKEVSLVLAGANPGAYIDNVIMHGDDFVGYGDEGWIYNGETIDTETQYELVHADDDDDDDDEPEQKKAGGRKTVKEIYDSLTDEQKELFALMVGMAKESGNKTNDKTKDEAKHSDNEGSNDMKTNVFEQYGNAPKSNALQHAEAIRNDSAAIFADAKQCGSFREAFLAHTATYGIDSITELFPDHKNINVPPEFIARDSSWATSFLAACKKSPFSKIKAMFADLTADEARAKGYATGNRKVEEVFTLLKRTTNPTTVYKKQKLDRDNIVDITDFDVVNWLWKEMRIMVNEELARAMLIGDGRGPSSDDKIDPLCIRPVWQDNSLYTINKVIEVDEQSTDPEADKANKFIEAAIRARKNYKGAGNPTLYTTEDMLTSLLLLKDGIGRRLYNTVTELATALRVKEIVTVEVMENQVRTVGEGASAVDYTLQGIIINPIDYVVGTTRGGEINTFQDFDIDYNQYKYLMETRCAGSLVKPYTAISIESTPLVEG